jgi:MtN3 and saliva related transmembrane protein
MIEDSWRGGCTLSSVMILAIGLVAAALTIISFVAQVKKILKTRDTSSLSTSMWLLSTTSFAVWVAYGALLRTWPIVVPNAVCCVLAAFILTLKLMPKHKRDRVADALEH